MLMIGSLRGAAAKGTCRRRRRSRSVLRAAGAVCDYCFFKAAALPRFARERLTSRDVVERIEAPTRATGW